MTHRKIPLHIAIIPDGNRRWAKEKGFIPSIGHYKAGKYDNLKKIFKEAQNQGVRHMSIWGFSTENWKRDKKEREAIFSLIRKGVDQFKKDSVENKIRFRHIGRKDRLPRELSQKLETLEKETAQHNELFVQLCLDYGGKDEIIRGVQQLIAQETPTVNEEIFEEALETSLLPPPDLIIRTGGEQRLSRFYMYHAAYAELYFTDTYFPDFGPEHLREALEEYSRRTRRYGGD